MLLPVIISGGAGERLWPVSNSAFPKPFIAMPDGQSLLQKAYLRADSLDNIIEILTITNRDYYFKTRGEYAAVSGSSNGSKTTINSFILEPTPRNTAPAIAIAAHYAVKNYGEDAVLLVLPADHLVENKEAFIKAVYEAGKLAEKNYLVTFGIKPTRPETGFGYIELGLKNLENSPNNYMAKNFVEKPNLQTAKSYIQGGNHVWNSGIFCFKAGVFLRELEEHSPQIANAVRLVSCTTDLQQASKHLLELNAELFNAIPSVSVDYAVLEKSANVAVVTCDIGWNDIGSWNALCDFIAPDEFGNRINGEVCVHNSHNCFVQASSRLVALVGVKNLVVIDTDNALLVADSGSLQYVRNIVQKIKNKEV
jgi:mannose-1-phosphate guanylyltransferase